MGTWRRNLAIGSGTNNGDATSLFALRSRDDARRRELLPDHQRDVSAHAAVRTSGQVRNSGRVSSVASEGDGLKNFVPYKPMAFLVVVTKPSERE